jgi:hypothetical protein
MKRLLVLVLLATAPFHSDAAEKNVLTFGGSISCATWLQQDESSSLFWRSWMLGYWTGRNAGGFPSVGHTTDGNGITGEVRLVCQSEPSLSLFNAVSKIYERFLKEGR